jgi:hypothetical protein
MQRKPKLAMAFAQLNGAVMDPAGEFELGFRRPVGHIVNKVSACLPRPHLLGAHNWVKLGACGHAKGSVSYSFIRRGRSIR